MYLLPMQLLIQQWWPAAFTGTIFLASVYGLYRIWYRNLPSGNESISPE